ncbi:MAG TPA: HAMP domain-containing protein [Candidatus Scalindua sp.]|nr:HAMP domain-containing protein [Candidatus Scalindua sp.]
MNNKTPIKNSENPTQRGFFFGIRSKMLLYFGLMTIAILVTLKLFEIYGMPFTNFGGEYSHHQSEALRNLNLVADLKKERLLHWVEERRDDAKVLSESKILRSFVARLIPVIKENIANDMKEDELWEKVKGEKTHQVLTQHLNLVKKSYGVYDRIQVAVAPTGRVIVSTQNEDLGTDISLQDSFSKILRPGYSEFMDIDKDPVSGILRLFISRTIDLDDNEGKISAVLIMHINPDDFVKPMLHTGGGLGKTGEALLIDRDVRIITSLKHLLEDGTVARPLEYQIKAKPAILAAQGEEGIIAANDYRGELVLAAFRHIRITSELGWGMVVKRDQAEIFAHLKESIYYFTLTLIASIFIVLGLTFLISINLSRPIRRLSRTVQKVAGGDLDARAQETTSDEVGILARGFNSMIQRIKDSQEELVRTERLVVLGKLSSGIAHEIRNPLGVIDSSAYYLKKKHKDADEKTMTHLNRIIKQTRISTDIVQSLQDLTRMKEPQKARMDIADVIEDGINVCIIPQTVKIIEKVPKDKLFVDADGRQLLIVFNNILNNAVQAMDNKGTIWVTADRGSNNWVEVSFKDSGPGITSGDLKKIFHSFFGTKAKGLGFGLTICQMIMEKHGGEIKAQSELGKGTTFIVRLPSIKANNERS